MGQNIFKSMYLRKIYLEYIHVYTYNSLKMGNKKGRIKIRSSTCFNGHFSEENVKLANKYMKRCQYH